MTSPTFEPMSVGLVDYMGTDLTVVNAARVSFDRESDWDYEGGLKPSDERLVQYLAAHGHWSPFSHAFASFRIKAPIFVARQLAKHQVGLAWNEVSRRYVRTDPTFYVPAMRAAADNVKQGSLETEVDTAHRFKDLWHVCALASLDDYQDALAAGVAPEVARTILPLFTHTEWVWSGSLYAWARVCNLRLDSHAQAETREVAQSISGLIKTLFPVSWKALTNHEH